MELFKIKRDIPFMRYGRVTTTISLVTFILAILALSFKGLNLGLDFTGGIQIEVGYSQPANLDTVRKILEDQKLTEFSVQNIGSVKEVLIRLPMKPETNNARLSEMVLAKLKEQDAGVVLRSVEFVGPQVGQELFESGGLALMLVVAGIMAYLAVRFEWRFALAAIIANMHDIVIILGMFAFFQWEFTLPVLAGVLAILGYSVNESVVVFDRVRENFHLMRNTSVADMIDNAITVTMSRTVITHFMTQLMVLAMFFFGGEALHNFALALTIGIVFGIYSSVLVASPILLWLGVSRQDLMVKKESAEIDDLP
ncbi:protein translocase subunit SecF [Candidatus Methylomicrobium oryzae]|jgi:preprotein translocase subunit SecF|uniref:protein translocase subunit SecF n=1 Tax=Candidatus Methylomicrobium oryzae TaxID=2802053 RepID=UPI0019222D94|nr:protein translocase subunit SecF [Methylomicrobium sp. RS1]MBL1263688.1 protein translocase subunit SecF [Methylomicrobium sp. RS1]